MTIIFYDIPSTLPDKAWSPNTWKTRYSLNYKGIPYTTEWIEYPDIEPFCKKHGIKPTTKKPDGTGDHYTLPAIHDPSTGAYIADSVLIAEYLDRTYPDTPALFPKNTEGLQLAFFDAFWNLTVDSLKGFALPPSCLNLNPASSGYFRRTREAVFGVTMEELVPKGDRAVEQWAKLEANLGKLDAWYAKTDATGPYMMGEEVSWADVIVVAHLIWLKRVWGEEERLWKDVVGWHGGRWGRLLQSMDKYSTIV